MLAYYFQLGLRSLRRNRWLTALMVLAIAVGIGAAMTTLTVMHLLSGDPLPDKSGSLFYAQVNPMPHANGHPPPDMMDYQSAMDLWGSHRADRQTLVVSSSLKVTSPGSDRSALMKRMLSTTSDFFPMFEVPFQYGHPWSAQADVRHARVAVISAALNDVLFGGANSVGRTLRLRDSNVRIVGVLKPWRPSPLFYETAGGRFAHGNTAEFYERPEDVFVPFQTGLEINDGHFHQFDCWNLPPRAGHLENSDCIWLSLWVQLDSPAKVASYRRYLHGYAAEQKRLGRFSVDDTRLRNLMQWLSYNQVVPSDVQLQASLAFAFLGICLFNMVGLLLAKFLRRSGEIGLRRALGASRGAIFAQCLSEAGVVGLLGGLGGWLLTLIGLWLVRQQPEAYADLAHMDGAMFALTFALSVFVSLLAGVLPALRASRVVPALQLKAL